MTNETLPAVIKKGNQKGMAKAKPTGKSRTPKDGELPAIFKIMHTGKSMRRACEQLNFDATNAMKVVNRDKTGGRLAEYQLAREMCAEVGFDRLGDIADAVMVGKIAPDVGRVAGDITKWRLARMNPAKFGDRTATELSGPGGGPIDSRVATIVVMEDNGRPRTVRN